MLSALTRLGFGGEDLLAGPEEFDKWHHRGISNEAARLSGWSSDAAAEVSWHADYVDSYLYNPLWWLPGGIPRLKAALSLAPPLTNVHFDDLTSVDQVQIMWRRYLSGTVAGVAWAAEHGGTQRVAAARHIVGVALHAVQDFYSHSNWVDDEARRDRLWSELTPAEQRRTPLFTGTYEADEHSGIHHHGAYSIACSVMQPISGVMDIMCHAISPFSNSAVCQIWKSCDDAEPIGSFEVGGVAVPDGLVYLDPPGIALDNTWLAEIGAEQRGLPGEGQELFGAARRLAVRESCAFLATVGASLRGAELEGFWTEVESGPSFDQSVWESQYEDFSRQGLHFIGTGTYPPEPTTREHEWFLRLGIETDASRGSGTDADIYARTESGRTLLDTMAGKNPLIAYNDFEAGDDQVFHIGPFRRLPRWIELENDSADIGDVFAVLGQAFIDALASAAETAVDFLLSIISGHADHIASNRVVWTPADLRGVGTGARPFTIRLDGRSEGDYMVEGTIRRTRRGTANGRPVSDYRVDLNMLRCIDESDWDRGSNSDEPFLYSMLINQASRDITSMMFGPYEDVDDDDRRRLNGVLMATNVPDGIGYLSLPVQLMESDDEGAGRRRQGFAAFKREFEDNTSDNRESLLAVLGRSIAADWKVRSFSVDAYRTGDDEIIVGRVLDPDRPGWIGGDERHRFNLTTDELTTIPIVREAGHAAGAGGEIVGGVDFFGDGGGEVFARSPWGVGVLDFSRRTPGQVFIDVSDRPPVSTNLGGLNLGLNLSESALSVLRDTSLSTATLDLTAPAINLVNARSRVVARNGTMLDGWRINTDDNVFGPVGRFESADKESVLVRSPWGIGVLGAKGGDKLAASMTAKNGTGLGGWLVDTDNNTFGPAADFDGDGRDELLVTSPWGMALLRLDRPGADPLMMAPHGTRFGGWLLNTTDNTFGPVGDFDGDGKAEVAVTSPWGLGILGSNGSGMAGETIAQNGTRLGDWLLNTADNTFGPVGDFDGDGSDELVVTSPWGMAILKVVGGRLVPIAMHKNGTRLGDWVLDTNTNRIVGSGSFTGGTDELMVSSPWGIGVLGLDAGQVRSRRMAPNGTSINGWNLQTTNNRLQVLGAVGSGGEANALITSSWGMALLHANDDGFEAEYIARNGTRIGDWLLNTDDNQLV